MRALDLQLERRQVDYTLSEPHSPSSELDSYDDVQESARVQKLKKIIKQLTVTVANASTPPYISKNRLLQLLKDAAIVDSDETPGADLDPRKSQFAYERELEWLLLGKATILVYGITFHALLEQTLPLSEDLYYWDEVLTSYRYTALYSVQIAPVKLLQYIKEIYFDAMKKFRALSELELPSINTERRRSEPMSVSLRKFYAIVRNSARNRIEAFHKKIRMTSPFTIIRHDIREKQAIIRRLRETQACSLGILVGETLNFDYAEKEKAQWKVVVQRAAFLMEKMIQNVSSVKSHTVEEFQDLIFYECGISAESPPSAVTRGAGSLSLQLQKTLQTHLYAQTIATRRVISRHGRPSLLVRYWAPATILLLSSSKILKIVARRQADLHVWVQETAATIFDFWSNWIIDPVRKILGTIRHDEDSEVALMSRRSLTADMESLERMVVEFAVDNHEVSVETPASSITPQELELIRERVKEGDLTPVLKAYERDLRTPFRGAVRGELVRALLIQIQKTKVDVEVAISGIDRLLKSQELVFGLVGLTPGILATWGVVRWFSGVMGGRRGMRMGQVSEEMLRVLR